MGEVSFARPANARGFSQDLVAGFQPYSPLFATAFGRLWSHQRDEAVEVVTSPPRLEDFAITELSPREGEVVQMILKGHSSQSIGLALEIALPTVKTHRKHAYAKPGISTQQQLFSAFLYWQSRQTDKL